MRYLWCTFGLLVVIIFAIPTTAHALSPALVISGPVERTNIFARDGGHDHHGHHDTPKLELDETEIEMYHGKTPPSYYTIDWEDADSKSRHPGLIMAHSLFMSLAFFGALPISIAMRSVKHSAHSIAVLSFYGLCTLGCAASSWYSKLTPNIMGHQIKVRGLNYFIGAKHGTHGWVILLLAVTLTVIDFFAGIRRCIRYLRSGEKFHFKTFWRTAILNNGVVLDGNDVEYAHLVQEPEEHEIPEIVRREVAQWSNGTRHVRHSSEGTIFGTESPTGSDDTLNGLKSRVQETTSKRSRIGRIGYIAFAVTERVLVFAGFAQVLSGIAVYTGGCRGSYINVCLAHLIKGGIFWCYGLVTFARFLGLFAEYGWAWNKAPSGAPYTAEFVESLVIFCYGISNTWMERFGASPGDPYTTKQIQHIGIAVMFWFAGLIGMGIESKRIRNLLASSVFSSLQKAGSGQGPVEEPLSYSGSFNPFPALVIGVTGAAMAAHFQPYVFAVQIHSLWGNLLVAFSVLRCFTYFFLWLGPPRSVLPSRPPTEALGSFFLACGGLVFMFSTEEVTIAAMRRGRDDVMMFLNVAVAMTCFAFCWTLGIVGFKGWLRTRVNPAVARRIGA